MRKSSRHIPINLENPREIDCKTWARVFYKHTGDVIASGSDASAWFLSTVHIDANMYKVFGGLLKKPRVLHNFIQFSLQSNGGLDSDAPMHQGRQHPIP